MSIIIEIGIGLMAIGYVAIKLRLAWHDINKRLQQIDIEKEES